MLLDVRRELCQFLQDRLRQRRLLPLGAGQFPGAGALIIGRDDHEFLGADYGFLSRQGIPVDNKGVRGHLAADNRLS